MLPSRLVRRSAAWLALLAMLMATLAPAISHALGPQAAAGWVEVCRAQGSRWVPAKPATEPIGSEAPLRDPALAHCAVCVIQTHAAGLPTASGPFADTTERAHVLRQATASTPCRLQALTDAQARAPPRHA